MKTGILLLNLGGPNNLDDVKPFLYRLFSDPDILVGVPAPFRQLLAFLISQLKGNESKKAYQLIGGGSPQKMWTDIQAKSLQSNFSESQFIKVTYGMRAWSPTIEEALEELKFWGSEKIVLLPLFPHFSTTTTGSSFKEVRRVLKKKKWNPEIIQVQEWSENTVYIEFLKQTLDEVLKETNLNLKTHILFSAHSLPMKIIEKGDPYLNHVNATIKKVGTLLNEYSWSLAYQSRNGNIPWAKPYVEDEIERLAKEGVQNLIVCPVSFVSDHIETLYELDILYSNLSKKLGIKNFLRTRTFNDDKKLTQLLKNIVEEKLNDRPNKL